MKSTIAAALLATTALATPLNLHSTSSPNSTISTRQVGAGEQSGIGITMYTDVKCKGDTLEISNMQYDNEYAQQMQSYSLTDDISDDDVLTFWADTDWIPTGSKPIDTSLNGDTSAACAQFVYSVVAPDTQKGCHTLSNVVGCVSIGIEEGPPPPPPTLDRV